MKVYVVNHQEFVPHEGVVNSEIYVFNNECAALKFCKDNSIREEKSWDWKDGEREYTEYHIHDGWMPEYLFIEEKEIHENTPELKRF